MYLNQDLLSLAKKKKGKAQDGSASNEETGAIKKDNKHDSDTSDSDDDWGAKTGKNKKKKVPSKRNKRKVTKSSSEESVTEKEPEKVSEPEEGNCTCKIDTNNDIL